MRSVLETSRLLLTTWNPEDWIAFRPIATDREVMRYITGGEPWTDDQIRGFVQRQIKLYEERGYCRWKLMEKLTGDLIGFCGVGQWQDQNSEIGWWLARKFWGRGLASEAARVALDDVFARSDLDRLISVAMTGNTASIRIMQKLGMKFDREWTAGAFQLLRYAITRSEYLTSVSARS